VSKSCRSFRGRCGFCRPTAGPRAGQCCLGPSDVEILNSSPRLSPATSSFLLVPHRIPMQEHRSAVKRSAQYDREGSNYNPFRRLRNRYRQYHLDGNDGKFSPQHLSSPPTETLIRTDTPRTYGQLFSATESYGDDPTTHQSTPVEPVISTSSTEKAAAHIDAEKSSPKAEAAYPPKHSFRGLNPLQWDIIPFGNSSQDTKTPERKQGHSGEFPIPIRTRRVVVAEYGITDNVKEGCVSISGAE